MNYIAVIAGSKRQYDNFTNYIHFKDKEKYKLALDANHLRGFRFYDYVRIGTWYQLKGLDDIERELKLSMTHPTTTPDDK